MLNLTNGPLINFLKNKNNGKEEKIYAKVKRTQNYSSKLIKFVDTIPAFVDSRNKIGNRNDCSNLKIAYNIEFKLPFNILDEKNKILCNISVDIDQSFLRIEKSVLGMEQLAEENNQTDNLRLFPFDQIFVGSLSNKLRLMPKALLTESIQSLLNGSLQNAVFLAIDGNESNVDNYGDQEPKAPLKTFNKFHQFLLHRGLMMHSIAWLFDAITIAPTNHHHHHLSPTTLNASLLSCSPDQNTCPKTVVFNDESTCNFNVSPSIQLSSSVVFHDRIIDLISFDFDGRRYNDPMDFITVDQEREYACANAKQAAHYLERSLNLYVKFKNSLFNSLAHQNLRSAKSKNSDDINCRLIEHLFVLTIHIYWHQFVPLGTSENCHGNVLLTK